MRQTLCSLLLALLFILSSAAAAQDNPLPPVPEASVPARDVDPALWVVQDSDTTIYLFGTVHILKPGLGWFDDGIKTAFDASDTLVVEMIDPSPAEVTRIMADLSIDRGGKPLREKLGAEDRAHYEAALTKLGLPAETFDPLDPWAAAINVYYAGLIRSGYDMTSGVETQLNAAAKAGRKDVIGLETMREQLSIFDRLPADVQLHYVVETVKSLDQIAPQTDRLVELWATADTDGVAAIMNEGFDQLDLTRPLLINRNANWARWVNLRMKAPGTVFVAVGAGHLAGTTSVQALLQAYGLNAQRIDY